MASKRSRDGSGLLYGEGTINERDGRFQARWRERQRDGSFKRRSATFSTRDLARAHLQTQYRDKRDGRFNDQPDMTVRELVSGWISQRSHTWSSSTIRSFRQRFELHIAPMLGDIPARSLTRGRVQHWIDTLQRGGLSPATVAHVVTVLSGALNEAVASEFLPRNPVHGTRRPTAQLHDVETWTVAEIQSVLATVASEPKWNALYWLAITTGMRPGEVLALSWADVDLNAGVVTVKRTLTRAETGEATMGTTTKTKRARSLSIAPETIRALKAWKAVQNEARLSGAHRHKLDIVFDIGNGHWMTNGSWRYYHAKLCTRAGVRLTRLHAIRHANATLELAAGTNPRIVADRLGHKGIEMTLARYTHVRPDVQQAAVQAFESRLLKTPEREDMDAKTP